MFADYAPEALYCLSDYSKYAIVGQPTDDVFREVSIQFETCNGDGCAEDIDKVLQSLVFNFRIADGILNPDATPYETFFTSDIVDLIYPSLPQVKMSMKIEIEQGILERHNDRTGTGIFQEGPTDERFFLLGDV